MEMFRRFLCYLRGGLRCILILDCIMYVYCVFRVIIKIICLIGILKGKERKKNGEEREIVKEIMEINFLE